MCRVMEDLRNESYSEGLARGVEQGELAKEISIAKRMKAKGMSDTDLADMLDITTERLKEILSSGVNIIP